MSVTSNTRHHQNTRLKRSRSYHARVSLDKVSETAADESHPAVKHDPPNREMPEEKKKACCCGLGRCLTYPFRKLGGCVTAPFRKCFGCISWPFRKVASTLSCFCPCCCKGKEEEKPKSRSLFQKAEDKAKGKAKDEAKEKVKEFFGYEDKKDEVEAKFFGMGNITGSGETKSTGFFGSGGDDTKGTGFFGSGGDDKKATSSSMFGSGGDANKTTIKTDDGGSGWISMSLG